MQIRRCSIVFLEPREDVGFDLENLLAGGSGVGRSRRWVALAPHLEAAVDISAGERELLGRLSPVEWVDRKTSAGNEQLVRKLLDSGLLIGSGKHRAAHRARDERLRDMQWHPLAATFHAFTRWSTLDTVQGMRDSGTETPEQMRAAFGPPPLAAPRRGEAASLPLPRAEPTAFDQLLGRRVTCRNFDAARSLPRALFAQLLQRVFSVQAEVHACEDTVFVKKTSPSGGGLHPVEAYLLVQNVADVAPGLYHYHALDHALEPLPMPALPLREFAMQAVAHQHWFADAHVLVVLAPRFDRTFWKYRQHAKAYRVIALEAGHLSQTLYLSATEAGLGAFITGAINEVPIEQAFGLDPLRDGAMAVCGFGWRGEAMQIAELDPVGEVWETALAGG